MRLSVLLLLLVAIAAVTMAHPGKGKKKSKARYFNILYQRWLARFCRQRFWFQWYNEFSTDRISLERTLVGTCTADVGTCPVGTCHYETRRHFLCPPDGFICPETETQQVDCGTFGIVDVDVVQSCGCCKDEGILIQGVVTSADTGDAVPDAVILVDDSQVATADENGAYSFTVTSDTSTVVFVVRDRSGAFLDAITVVDIPENFRGPVEQDVVLISQAPAIEITDPTVDNTLSLSGNPENPNEGVAQIVFQANTIVDADGNPVTGPIQVSINYLDTSNPDIEALLPGRFITDGGEQLISDGIFNLEVTDENGNELGGTVLIKVREGMTLWNLDEATGSWVQAEILNSRKRRQIVLTEELLVQISNNRWVNIDKIPNAPRCYFKARVTFDNPADAANPATYRPQILAFTPANERLRIYAPSTSDPDTTCFEVRCLDFDPAEPSNVLFGFINLTSTESVILGGVSVPIITQLEPLELSDYSAAIQTAHSAVQYAVAANERDIFVNFISSANGPFYQDRATCEASTFAEPAFNFTKPELPSYEVVPEDTEICTARVGFQDGWNFYDTLANLTESPEVTAISTWSVNGSDFYFTDTTTIELFSDGNSTFYFACIQYRCGSNDSETEIFFRIDAPLIEVNATTYFDDNINNTNSTTMMVPAFSCYGECFKSEICYDQNSGVNGTLTVSDNGPDGPDFWNNTMNDCTTRDENEFATTFYCNGNRMIDFEGNNGDRPVLLK